MVKRKMILKAVALLALVSSAASGPPQVQGRKLFGGYRIAPKMCRPTNPSRIRSDVPAVCMFNYECTQRRGEVVGACMDGFLFGACCQLPGRPNLDGLEKTPLPDELDVHEIDHVPDVPILLNPDGTPVGSSTGAYATKDTQENAERPQISQLEEGYPALLAHDQVLDDLKLPTLLMQPANELREPSQPVSPVATLLSPDQVFQVADPVDQLPALFSHGIDQDNATGPETILLNKNGSVLDETHNPDELFKPTLSSSLSSSSKFSTATATSTNKISSSMSSSMKVAATSNKAVPLTTKPLTKATTPAKATTLLSTKLIPVATKLTSLSTKATTRPTPLTTKSASATTRPTPLTTKSTSATTATRTITRSTTEGTKSTQQKSSSAAPSTYEKSASSSHWDATTPMTSTTRRGDDLVRVPTVAYSGQSGNKKHDELDREEIAINHIISLLNDTGDAKLTTQAVTNGPTTYKWVSPDALVKVSTSYPSSTSSQSYSSNTVSPNYYHYNTEPSRFTDYYGSSSPSTYQTSTYQESSSGTTYGYSSKPTTNQPAPTVIVLGPFGTEYSTVPTPSTPTYGGSTRPVRPSLPTKKPSVATTLTHNISTVISGNKQVVSVSVFSVHKDGTTSKPLKDKLVTGVTKRPSTIYTTLTSWSEKPSFHLKPATATFHWPEEETIASVTKPGFTTTGSNCEDETAASDDVNNFPPVRHPELDSTATHLQDKPTLVEPGEIISEDEIPTPDFVEDAELNNKVDVFVSKIVESLQGNFQNLKDVVYNPTNATRPAAVTTTSATTRRPPAATTRRPAGTTRPSSVKPTRRPVTTRLTTTPKTSSTRPKATTPATKKPVTSKRTKPVRKPTTPLPISEAVDNTEATTFARPTEITTTIPEITPNADFRSICGIRPLIKTGRIVGGKGATFGEWPWQVLVREATWLGLFTKNKCGGVLITDKYVITAAHCQPGFLASLVAVFGEFDISGELESRRSVTRNVRRVIVNRAYDPATFENDLALLELESPVQFDAHIVPICMPDDNTDYVNRMATVTGWGRLKYNGGVPSVLQEVKVPIMDNSVCQEMFQMAGHSKLILESFMCAGYANGQKDSCEGDSGGPLTLQRPDGRWILVGTVSHGIKCAAPYLPGVYMRTTYFKPWLHSITGV